MYWRSYANNSYVTLVFHSYVNIYQMVIHQIKISLKHHFLMVVLCLYPLDAHRNYIYPIVIPYRYPIYGYNIYIYMSYSYPYSYVGFYIYPHRYSATSSLPQFAPFLGVEKRKAPNSRRTVSTFCTVGPNGKPSFTAAWRPESLMWDPMSCQIHMKSA